MKSLANMSLVKYRVFCDNQVDPRMLPNCTTVNLIGIDNFRRIEHIDQVLCQRFGTRYNIIINHAGRTIKISHREQDQEWKRVIEST